MYHEHNRTQPWVTQKKTIPSCPQCTRAAKERLAWWEYTRWYCTKKLEGLWLHGRKPGYTIPQDGRAIYYFWETCHWTFCRQNRCKKIAWQKNVTERLGWAMQQEAKERVLVIIIHPRLKPGENGCPIWDRENKNTANGNTWQKKINWYPLPYCHILNPHLIAPSPSLQQPEGDTINVWSWQFTAVANGTRPD